MTQPRNTYAYDSQVVRSPQEVWRLEFHAGDRRLELSSHGNLAWSRDVGMTCPKQLFVSDDGVAAVLDAADEVQFFDASGASLAHVSLLKDLGDRIRGALSQTTAGPVWDDYIAGTLVSAPRTTLLLEGRGAEIVAIDATSGAAGALPASEASPLFAARVEGVLREALRSLRQRQIRTPALPYHEAPWRLAATGWCRVAGRLDLTPHLPAVLREVLAELGQLELSLSGTTTLSCGGSVARDPIRTSRYALDALRQASHTALRRHGHRAPHAPVIALKRRRGLVRLDELIEVPSPDDYPRALATISEGAAPSSVVATCGAPTHIEWEPDFTVAWYFDHADAGHPATTRVTWGRRGATSVRHEPSIPPPTPQGRVA